MIVLHHNQEQLIIGADTRKIALLMVGGFILICLGIYALLANSPLNQGDISFAAMGIAVLLGLFVIYYFYRVFEKTSFTFDKPKNTLTVQASNIFGTKTTIYPLDHITKVEAREKRTYAYAPSLESHALNSALKRQTADTFTTLVLLCRNTKEINLNPNAAYFFLHTFDALTNEVDNGLGSEIAKFIGVPFAQIKILGHN